VLLRLWILKIFDQQATQHKNNSTITIAMNDIGKDNVCNRTPETTSTISTSKPAAKTILKDIKWSDVDICPVTNKPCGVDGVYFEKLSAKDVRAIGCA